MKPAMINIAKFQPLIFSDEELLEKARSMSALIVEDDAKFRQAMIDAIEPYFGRVVTANDGWAGFMRFGDQGPFDIVLTDFSMDGLNGAQLIREIMDLKPSQKFILTTAYDQVDEVSEIFLNNSDNVFIVSKNEIGNRPHPDDGRFWNKLYATLVEIEIAKDDR